MHHGEEIIQAEVQELISRDHHLLLLRRERGQEVVKGMRPVIDIYTVTLAPSGRGVCNILPGQLAIRDGGECCWLGLATDLRCRRSLLMQLDVHELAPG